VTLEGSFDEFIAAKTARAHIGAVTSGAVGACISGSATVMRETLPWAVQYSSFSGTLPAITSVGMRLVGAAFRIAPIGLGTTCGLRTTEANPGTLTASVRGSGVEGTLLEAFSMAVGGSSIPLESGACAFGTGGFVGTGTLTPLGAAGTVRIALTEAGARGIIQAVPFPTLSIPAERSEGTIELGNSAPLRSAAIRLNRIWIREEEANEPNRERTRFRVDPGVCVGKGIGPGKTPCTVTVRSTMGRAEATLWVEYDDLPRSSQTQSMRVEQR